MRGLIRFDFGTGTYGFCRSTQPITYESLEYQPHSLISVSDISLEPGTIAREFMVRLTASQDDTLTPDMLKAIFAEDYRDRPVTVMDAHYSVDTGELVEVKILRTGRVNKVDLVRDSDLGDYIEAPCFSRGIDYSRSNGRQATHEDQQRRVSGFTDKFLRHSSMVGRTDLYFGRKRPRR